MDRERSGAATAASDVLRGLGLRVTGPRVAVLEVLHDHPHSDADEIGRRVRERVGAVSTQAVYDVLRFLSEHGLVHRFEPAGSRARYEIDPHDNHHHVVCRSCGRIDDVACAVGHAPCLDASDPRGYLIDEAQVIYWGLCPACQAAEPDPDRSTTTPTTTSTTTSTTRSDS